MSAGVFISLLSNKIERKKRQVAPGNSGFIVLALCPSDITGGKNKNKDTRVCMGGNSTVDHAYTDFQA